MDQHGGTLLLLQLLPLTLSYDLQNVFVDKRIGSETDVTPVCSNKTDKFIRNIYCKINKRDSGRQECSLGFIEKKLVNGCGSRINLLAQNQTVFLQLTGFTPEDSGLYSCECSTGGGYSYLHLNITVEASEDQSSKTTEKYSDIDLVIMSSSIPVFIIIIIIIIIVGYVCKRRNGRRRSRPELKGGEEMDTYTALQRPDKDLYETIADVNSGSRHKHVHREEDYENVKESINRGHF